MICEFVCRPTLVEPRTALRRGVFVHTVDKIENDNFLTGATFVPNVRCVQCVCVCVCVCHNTTPARLLLNPVR